MTAGLLRASGVVKAFGGLTVLDGIDLDVEPGSIAGLIGPNGSGKSTLFDILTGYQTCDAGDFHFAGTSLLGMAPHEVSRRGLVRTFQLTRIFRSMTVAENLLVFAERVAGGAGDEKAAELLRFMGLTRLAHREAADLSYGQQKLLEIAQVLMLEPRLLMLDEPMAGVNPALADEIVTRLQALRDGGMTLLLIEHNIPVVLRLCDRLTVLAAGTVMASGDPATVLAQPDVREAFLGA